MTLLALAVSLALLQTPAATPQVTKGSIEGTVVQGQSATPLAGARVILTRVAAANAGGGVGPGGPVPLPAAPPNPPQAPPPGLTGGTFVIQSIAAPAAGVGAPGAANLPSATTDGQGRYLLKDVDPGNYRVTFAANGYVKQDYGQKSFSGPGIPIAVTAGKATKDIDISMTPAGNMTGHLRDSAGMPVAGVPIQLLRATYNASGQKGFQTISSDRTDDRGEYRLYWVTPGRYYLNAGTAPGPTNRPLALGGGGSPNQVPGESFVYTFYPGVSNLNQAVAIEIAAGSEISGIDMIVSRQQQLNVRGKVVDSRTGLPPASANISLSYQVFDGGGTFGTANNYNPSTGTFEVTNINPGSYTLVATLQDSNYSNAAADPAARARVSSASLPVDIVNGDIENIVLTLAAGSPLSGRVVVDGIQPSSVSAFRVQLRPSANGVITNSVGLSLPQIPATNPDGTLRIDAVNPGEYRIAMSGLPSEYYLKDARFGQNDVLNQPMQFASGDTATLDILISSGAVQLEGSALGEKSEPVPGITVVLIPDQHRDRTELYKNTTTDAAGRYFLRGIAPGEYRLYAWDSMEPYSWFDPDVIRRDEGKGKPVRILEGSNQTIDVRVISGP